jgi:hypothetical protein
MNKKERRTTRFSTLNASYDKSCESPESCFLSAASKHAAKSLRGEEDQPIQGSNWILELDSKLIINFAPSINLSRGTSELSDF